MNDDDLTPFERKAMEALPREQTPGPLLEERVVQALHDRGVLGPRKRRILELTAVRIAVAAAAAIVLLLGGFALGRWTGGQPGAADEADAVPASRLALAASVQRAGTAYLSAIEELATADMAPDSDEMRQGREVALTTLYSAAGEVTRIVPKRHMAGQLIKALDVRTESDASPADEELAERVIWF
jgi:hypothetical protein